MARTLDFNSLSLTLLLLLLSGGKQMSATNLTTWCVANPCGTTDDQLQANIDFVCSIIQKNCSIIQEGGTCFYPNTLISHASIVMNLYYYQMGPAAVNCDFKKTGLTVITNPSYGLCYMPES